MAKKKQRGNGAGTVYPRKNKDGKFGLVLVYRLDRLGRSLLVIVDAHDRLDSLERRCAPAANP